MLPSIWYSLPTPKGKEAEWELQRKLAFHDIVRVPTPVHQAMADCTGYNQGDHYCKDEAMRKMREILIEWLDENYKDYSLSSFVELLKVDTAKIHPDLQWGIYVKLYPKVGDGEVLSLEDSLKAITNG